MLFGKEPAAASAGQPASGGREAALKAIGTGHLPIFLDMLSSLIHAELRPDNTGCHAEVSFVISIAHFAQACAATPADAQVMHYTK